MNKIKLATIPVILICVVAISALAFIKTRAATSGPNFPSTGAAVAPGDRTWVTPSNVTASDDARATDNLLPGETSYYLQATNFGFSIPAGATIDGVTATIEISRGSGSGNRGIPEWDTVQLIVGGTKTGTNNASQHLGEITETTDTNYTFGGVSDGWGLSLTTSDVNATDFGVAIRIVETDNGPYDVNVLVDSMQLTITYTAGAEPVGQMQLKAGTINIKNGSIDIR